MSRRKSESGFALLLVFAMASVIAISLYYSMPRVAFEAQRDKEQTLIDRGEQYKRAIQLYVRKNKRWSAKVEDLESDSNRRYLRRRYVDPMTGKDEWRPVHVGANGVLTDSLVKPLGKDKKDTKEASTFITELQPIGGNQDPTAAQNPALRRRPSDQAPAGGGNPGDPTNPINPANPINTAGANFPQQGFQPGSGQTNPNGLPPGLNGTQGGTPNGLPQQLQQPGANGQPAGGFNGSIGVMGSIGTGQQATGYSTAPGANGATPAPGAVQTAGQIPGQAPGQNNAAALIQGLLTSPRPGGAPPGLGTQQAGQITGGGIAGFASKFEGSAIKSYNDQDEYQKWEFVYDMSKDVAVTGGQNAIPQPAGPNSPPGSTNGPTGQSATGMGFGQPSVAPGAQAGAPGTGFNRPNPQ